MGQSLSTKRIRNIFVMCSFPRKNELLIKTRKIKPTGCNQIPSNFMISKSWLDMKWNDLIWYEMMWNKQLSYSFCRWLNQGEKTECCCCKEGRSGLYSSSCGEREESSWTGEKADIVSMVCFFGRAKNVNIVKIILKNTQLFTNFDGKTHSSFEIALES